MQRYISGIQQMGIGVPDVENAFRFYRKYLGMDVKIFEDAASAPLMTKYTGGEIQSRTATLAINLNGGGGFEIWQYTSRELEKAKFNIQLGDYGIFITRIKCRNILSTFDFYKKENVKLLSEVCKTPHGQLHFYFKDPYDNIFEIVESSNWFSKTKHDCGGVEGALIGVSNMEASLNFYKTVLGYDTIVYDETRQFEDFNGLEGGSRKFRRVLLKHSVARSGPFSNLLGESHMELIELQEEQGRSIFENRFWGDWGFIHLCFDIKGMQRLRLECEELGYPFTVDSNSTFDMGEAGGQFAYVEDPDGTLIEFVETHRIPVIKKVGWYMNLQKRPINKPLPKWMVKALAFNRIKD